MKIAIIEDDSAIAQMYKIKLEAEGYNVATANNGEDGLNLLQATKPNLVLLDLMMPKMSGDEMLTKMRQTNWGKDIKVVVITNITETKVADKVRRLGVIDILTKAQYTPAQIADKVHQYLANTQ